MDDCFGFGVCTGDDTLGSRSDARLSARTDDVCVYISILRAFRENMYSIDLLSKDELAQTRSFSHDHSDSVADFDTGFVK